MTTLDPDMIRRAIRYEFEELRRDMLAQIRDELQAAEVRRGMIAVNEWVGLAEVEEITGLGRTEIWKLRRHGEFVQTFGTKNRPRFRRSEVEAWVESSAR